MTSHPTPIAEKQNPETPELGETHFEKFVARWRAAMASAEASESLDIGAHSAALRDAISVRQARVIGVAIDDWLTPTPYQPAHLTLATKLLHEVDAAGLDALWSEPHTLGWFHQHFGLNERLASNRAHTKDERKHRTQTTTTRLYTPRWVADFLANACLHQLHQRDAIAPTVCDPAVGGGQMLLAALDAMIARGAEPGAALGRLHGVDLDPDAVEITFRNLAMHAARRLGQRDRRAEAQLRAHLHVGDGLFDNALFVRTPRDRKSTPKPPFDIVLANLPYMGSRSMPVDLKSKISHEFKHFHADLYTAFIRRCHQLARHSVGILAQQTVWYLSRFKQARAWLLDQADLVEYMHLGAGAFHNLSGEKANVVAFVQKIRDPEQPHINAPTTHFIDLRGAKGAGEKCRALRDNSALSYRESTAALTPCPGECSRTGCRNRFVDIFSIPAASPISRPFRALRIKPGEIANSSSNGTRFRPMSCAGPRRSSGMRERPTHAGSFIARAGAIRPGGGTGSMSSIGQRTHGDSMPKTRPRICSTRPGGSRKEFAIPTSAGAASTRAGCRRDVFST